MATQHDQALGDLARLTELGRRARRKDRVGTVCALGLVAYGIWPLGAWHALPTLVGLLWLLVISEGPAYRLADEVDLLEQKLAERLAESR